MLHNLKKVLGQKLAINAISEPNALEWKMQQIGRYCHTTETSLANCWNCGNAGTANNVQFKCNKCQHLLDLPANVVYLILCV